MRGAESGYLLVSAFKFIDGSIRNMANVLVGLILECLFQGRQRGPGLFIHFVQNNGCCKASPLVGTGKFLFQDTNGCR